ncbi:unnamed protein product [Pleuronectes platessa]|uniref:Uncharacterized protein n=1 Tax=Pleuronectes platessa TaxID=8262 RepID=A0A9N7U6T3_PLEPL|nr:unnamed protein product [Pleuronectes platessa]
MKRRRRRRRRPQNTAPSENKITARGPEQRREKRRERGRGARVEINNMLRAADSILSGPEESTGRGKARLYVLCVGFAGRTSSFYLSAIIHLQKNGIPVRPVFSDWLAGSGVGMLGDVVHPSGPPSFCVSHRRFWLRPESERHSRL